MSFTVPLSHLRAKTRKKCISLSACEPMDLFSHTNTDFIYAYRYHSCTCTQMYFLLLLLLLSCAGTLKPNNHPPHLSLFQTNMLSLPLPPLLQHHHQTRMHTPSLSYICRTYSFLANQVLALFIYFNPALFSLLNLVYALHTLFIICGYMHCASCYSRGQ